MKHPLKYRELKLTGFLPFVRCRPKEIFKASDDSWEASSIISQGQSSSPEGRQGKDIPHEEIQKDF